MTEKVELNINVLIVGDSNVGKTSLLFRYIDDSFPDKHLATLGVEYHIKKIEYKEFLINLRIWDTAGQERFHSITNSFFHHADGILFVYDITNYKSFEGVKRWIKESEEINNSFKKILLGNKCDLKDKRCVTEKDTDKFCKEINISLIETSAKDNINLNIAFNKITELILEGKSDEEIKELFCSRVQNVSFSTNNPKKKKKEVKCC